MISHRPFYRSSTRQRGATLVESMVSLFVFAVGALGIAALQTTSLVRVDDTRQRSLAIWKAQGFVDRMRSTKIAANPDGLLPEYLDEIGNDNNGNTIGKIGSANEYNCPVDPPPRCDDRSDEDAAACAAAQMVQFDLWSVMCDPISGLAADVGDDDGTIAIRNVEIAMTKNGNEYRLYLEWLSRSANNNENLQSDEGRTVTTNLCGDDEQIDTRLDALCLRFE